MTLHSRSRRLVEAHSAGRMNDQDLCYYYLNHDVVESLDFTQAKGPAVTKWLALRGIISSDITVVWDHVPHSVKAELLGVKTVIEAVDLAFECARAHAHEHSAGCFLEGALEDAFFSKGAPLARALDVRENDSECE